MKLKGDADKLLRTMCALWAETSVSSEMLPWASQKRRADAAYELVTKGFAHFVEVEKDHYVLEAKNELR